MKDSIAVKVISERPDKVIADEVQNAIAIDVWLEQCVIVTNVKDGVVTLTGVVEARRQRPRHRACLDRRGEPCECRGAEDRAMGQA